MRFSWLGAQLFGVVGLWFFVLSAKLTFKCFPYTLTVAAGIALLALNHLEKYRESAFMQCKHSAGKWKHESALIVYLHGRARARACLSFQMVRKRVRIPVSFPLIPPPPPPPKKASWKCDHASFHGGPSVLHRQDYPVLRVPPCQAHVLLKCLRLLCSAYNMYVRKSLQRRTSRRVYGGLLCSLVVE